MQLATSKTGPSIAGNGNVLVAKPRGLTGLRLTLLLIGKNPIDRCHTYPQLGRNAKGNTRKSIEIATLRAELHAAREKIGDLKLMADEIREDRDAWESQANRLLSAPQPEQKKGFWERVLNR